MPSLTVRRGFCFAAVLLLAGAASSAVRASGAGSSAEGGVVGVAVDVLPGTHPNRIRVGSGAGIPVALLTTPMFDASAADGASLCFGDAEDASARDCTEEHGKGHADDVDADGDLDLILHYQEPQTGIDRGDTRACLNGRTGHGGLIEGCDDILTE